MCMAHHLSKVITVMKSVALLLCLALAVSAEYSADISLAEAKTSIHADSDRVTYDVEESSNSYSISLGDADDIAQLKFEGIVVSLQAAGKLEGPAKFEAVSCIGSTIEAGQACVTYMDYSETMKTGVMKTLFGAGGGVVEITEVTKGSDGKPEYAGKLTGVITKGTLDGETDEEGTIEASFKGASYKHVEQSMVI